MSDYYNDFKYFESEYEQEEDDGPYIGWQNPIVDEADDDNCPF